MINITTEVLTDPVTSKVSIRFHARMDPRFTENIEKMLPMVLEQTGISEEEFISLLRDEMLREINEKCEHLKSVFDDPFGV